MSKFQDKLALKIDEWRSNINELLKTHGDKVVSEVKLAQVYGGMRGVKGICCDTSEVDPQKGLIIRGIPLGEITDLIPEEIWYLLLMGERPNEEELKELQQLMVSQMAVPDYVWNVLRAMPEDSHPMAMLSTAIVCMERESVFIKKYQEGIQKVDFWKASLEECIYLVAKLPTIAAGIYRIRYKKGDLIEPDPNLAWGANFARMLGIDDPDGVFSRFVTLYLTIHCDHEGGNVSAFSSQTIGSALSNVFYALSGGLNGLAGPLHGLANQECLKFVLSIHEKFGGVPSDEDLKKFVWSMLNSGRVIPGFGHAVLRVTDPRYSALFEYASKHCTDSDVYKIVSGLFKVVPDILTEHGKAKSVWPNVDATSGMLLYYFGLKEFEYYTVFFGVSRALGITSQLVMNRAMLMPITRPKSVNTKWVKNFVQS